MNYNEYDFYIALHCTMLYEDNKPISLKFGYEKDICCNNSIDQLSLQVK